MFHSEILASINFNTNKLLSPGLENNNTLKCCPDNFPTWSSMSRLLENTRSTFKCMVILKSRGQGPKKIENYRTKLSRTFNKNLDLVPWIGE